MKTITTKKGDNMAFITGSDETGTKEFVVFPKVYLELQNVQKGMLLKVRGHV